MRSRISILITTVLVAASGLVSARADVCPPHPYPCGDEWPAGLEGPFELASVEYVKVPSFDGTLLAGWIGRPSVPAGVDVPVALYIHPSLGDCFPTSAQCTSDPSEPAYWTSEPSGIPPMPANNGEAWTWGIAPIELIRHGIAAAFFTPRGSGSSGGCFEFGGAREQADSEFLLDWVASQPWSNGRVAMGGLSYAAWTAFQAGVTGHPALKTLVAGGLVNEPYSYHHSPQGAANATVPPSFTYWKAAETIIPPGGGGVQRGVVDHVPLIPERLCEETVAAASRDYEEVVADHRDGAYYDERRLSHRLRDVTAASLIVHGIYDTTGHAFQDSLAWAAMPNAPKRMIEGRWQHTFPMPEIATLNPAWEHDTWDELMLAWLDYWLWGKGPTPERLGTVSYQDQHGGWHDAAAWPPGEDEVAFLSDVALTPAAGTGARGFRTVPTVQHSYHEAGFWGVPANPFPVLCPDVAAGVGSGAVYLSEPFEQEALVAGNPFAYLRLTSDAPGGIVGVHLLSLSPGWSCGAGQIQTDAHVIGFGAADLRFHAGGYDAVPFPVGTPTNVRVDLWDGVGRILPGGRLAVVVSAGEGGSNLRMGKPYAPEIVVHGDSQIVVPFVEGTLGGAAPTIDYPPRPFSPVSS